MAESGIIIQRNLKWLIYSWYLLKGGDGMEVLEEINNAEIMQRAMDDFREVQDFMALAKKENAIETYARLKRKYTTLKALLNSLGVNMTDIDEIKE